jgi:CheY-like chemotaxis protein
MDTFALPKFADSVVGIAQAYGPLTFWLEQLNPDANPDGTWRALMLMGCLKKVEFAYRYRLFLAHRDSRVRAWACFALGQAKDEESAELIHGLNGDPSTRVRIHAWQAIRAIVGAEYSQRLFPIRNPPINSLVLISEDNQQSQINLARMFSRAGYRVEVASSELETMRAALSLRPQAIVTDNQKYTDDFSGINMIWDIVRRPELRETVLFMLTADYIEPVFLWHGGDFFLHKSGASVDRLAEVANEYLHH